jgi:hypothetical protein
MILKGPRRRLMFKKWFLRGLVVWFAVALVLSAILPGRAAALMVEGRNAAIKTYGAWTAPTVQTADYAPIAHTSVNPFGINTFLYQEVEEAKIRRSLEMIKNAGFGFIREQVAWQEIERGQKGGYWDERWNRPTWDKLDRLVTLVNEYDLDLIARLDYPPDWALPPGETWHATPPADYEDYGDFVHTIVSRYRGQIKYYQIWNEPNLSIEWGMKPVDPAAYVRLLGTAYKRAKEADPNVVVLAAALAPTIEQGPLNLSDIEYLRRMYEAGAKDYFDIASLNPYGLRSGPDDRRFSDDDTNFSRPIRAREIMVEFGDENKPIWASESGWCALPADYPYPPSYGRVTLEQQSEYTRRAYERVQQEWPWLGVVSLWHFRMVDNRLATQQPYYFGVAGDDFSPHPVYESLSSVATAPPTMHPGFRHEDHPAISYGGQWQTTRDERAALDSFALGQGKGTSISARFWGSDLDIVVSRLPGGATLSVRIDGAAAQANALERDGEGRAVLRLQAEGETWQESIPLARGLGNGFHMVELEIVDGDGVFRLDGFVVRPASEGDRLLLLLGLGLVIGISALGMVIVARRRSEIARDQPDRPASPVVRARLLANAGALVTALLALWLRTHQLAGQSYWYDEGISVSLAARSLAQITRDAAADIHPPVYYYLLHFWIKLAGNGEYAVRFLSAALGVVAVCLIYQLGKRLFSPSVGLVAALLAALSPLAVYYGQEARMYSLLLALTCLWSLGWLWLLEQREPLAGGRRTYLPWVAYIALGIVSVYTHYFAFFLLAFYNVWTFGSRLKERRFLLVWAASQAVIVLSFVPWLAAMSFGQLSSFQSDVSQTPLADIALRAFDDFTLGHKAIVAESARMPFVGMIVAAIIGAILGGARSRRGLAMATLYLMIPILAILMLSLTRSAYQARLVMLALPGLLLLFAFGVVALGRLAHHVAGGGRRGQVLGLAVGSAALAILVLPTNASLQLLYGDEQWRRDDYRGLVQHITANAKPSDAIVLDSPGQIDTFALYYAGQQRYYPLPSQLPIDEAGTESELREILTNHSGLWAVLWGTAGPDPNNFVERWLDANAFKATDSWYGGVRLAYYLVETPGERQPSDARFGDELKLQGYAWKTREGVAGDVLPLTLYWQALKPIEKRYKVFVHVLDAEEKIWGQRDSEPSGGAKPTVDWLVGQEVEDRIGVPLQADISPGTYEVEIGLYDSITMERPTIFAADGRELGNRLLVGPIEVRAE